MSGYRILLATRAAREIAEIDAWWRRNRASSPLLFFDEVDAALARLAVSPQVGSPYSAAAVANVRRIRLPRTHYHLYYTAHDQERVVRVRAVWHVARGTGPRLR